MNLDKDKLNKLLNECNASFIINNINTKFKSAINGNIGYYSMFVTISSKDGKINNYDINFQVIEWDNLYKIIFHILYNYFRLYQDNLLFVKILNNFSVDDYKYFLNKEEYLSNIKIKTRYDQINFLKSFLKKEKRKYKIENIKNPSLT